MAEITKVLCDHCGSDATGMKRFGTVSDSIPTVGAGMISLTLVGDACEECERRFKNLIYHIEDHDLWEFMGA